MFVLIEYSAAYSNWHENFGVRRLFPSLIWIPFYYKISRFRSVGKLFVLDTEIMRKTYRVS